MALEKIIHDSLAQFIHSHVPDADLSVLDEVILSYITSVLEELGSPDASEENFDVEMFVEMMAAYIPGFAEISSVTICEMMFDLAARLIEARNKENVPPLASTQDKSSSKVQASDREEQESTEPENNSVAGEGASAKEGRAKVEDGVQLLVEMFPSSSLSVMRQVLSVAKGNLDYAVQLIMEGIVEQLDTATLEETHPKTDKKIKASILEKYMMVDNDDDVKTHKPIAPKEFHKLNALMDKLSHSSFTVLAFPCNQFGQQDPEKDHEILNVLKFVRPGGNFVPKFPIFGKIEVNGEKEHPLYTFLKVSCPFVNPIIGDRTRLHWSPLKVSDVRWNFEKFLVDVDGQPFKRYDLDAPFDIIEDDISTLQHLKG
ncbi:CUE domain-containing protein 2-A-like [Carcharodon carcharias]|uniref:CUE domain-containing protein 2-A-like n=1 Tax=Carcharodon carcharias TaxID=13397 RepID=UPI001B7F4302|nr:CUE domain-containing protein 2-A-like [Carcharodon carcharias]XP_041031986.1 CUE domain-containing protein 2-A-like [Carcharodon carcharias]XP_041031988.1 CUE domain-containing protein 2-A-like [Carcharodon carcharias]